MTIKRTNMRNHHRYMTHTSSFFPHGLEARCSTVIPNYRPDHMRSASKDLLAASTVHKQSAILYMVADMCVGKEKLQTTYQAWSSRTSKALKVVDYEDTTVKQPIPAKQYKMRELHLWARQTSL